MGVGIEAGRKDAAAVIEVDDDVGVMIEDALMSVFVCLFCVVFSDCLFGLCVVLFASGNCLIEKKRIKT